MGQGKFSAPRGTQDIFGENVKKWQYMERIARALCERYNIQEIRTPVFEHTEVFARENDASDMVNKEMYTFKDRGDRSLTLRPETTAGISRAFVEHKLYASGAGVQRLYSIGPSFRYERPQKGRMRIFHQFDIEVFSKADPYIDVETIMIGLDYLNELGITKYQVVVNTLGDKESQAAYRQTLVEYFEPHVETLCGDCQRRYTQNPLRILDCKIDHDHPAIVNAPKSQDSLNDVSKDYFDTVCNLLDEMNIDYRVDDKMVRGLDYYNHTVFEVVSTDPNAGAQSTIFAGGRYSQMVEYFGGPKTDAIGFAIGLERALLYAEMAEVSFDTLESIDIYGMPRDKDSCAFIFKAIQKLRHAGYSADMDYELRSMKAQFKTVDRSHAKVAIICGETELSNGELTLKNIETQEQRIVKEDELLNVIASWLGE